jgi:hypothetical protein
MTVLGRIFNTIRRHLHTRLHSPPSRDPQAPAEPVLPLEEEARVRDLSRTLASELFAHLLLELPAYRMDLSGFYRTGDIESLAKCTHKLRGAVVYCDAPELLHGLNELQQALKTGDTESIDINYARTINIIDNTLADSGQR